METFPSWRKGKRWITVFLLAMAVVHMVVLWQDHELMASGYGDFSAFYTAGIMMRRGMAHELYVPQEQWRIQQEFAQTVTIRKGPMPYVRPPFEALLFLPMAYFSYPIALAIWSALKIGCLWLALWILRPLGTRPDVYSTWFLLILCVGFFPVFLDLYQGQDALLLLFLVVLALRQLLTRHDTAAGVVLGLGMFKFHLVLPIAIMLSLSARPRILRGFLPAIFALVAISVWLAGPAVLCVYPAYLLELNHLPGAGMISAQSMPNLRGMLTSLVGRAPYPGPIHWLLLPLAILAMGITVWAWRRAGRLGFGSLSLGFSLALLVAVLFSYYALPFDLMLCLIPAAVITGELQKGAEFRHSLHPPSRIWFSIGAGGLLLLFCAPLYWILILYGDRPYLLSIPAIMLALGIARTLLMQREQREVS